MFRKNILEILKEAANAEDFCDDEEVEYTDCDYDDDDADDVDLDNMSNEDLEALKKDIIDSYDNMEEVDDQDLEYTEEMVPVIATANGSYLIEYDNLAKLMESKKCDAYTAINSIAESNNIELAKIKLVVESQNTINSILEAKASSKKARRKKTLSMKSSASLLKDIKNKGITLVKKKNRKSKKRKKS